MVYRRTPAVMERLAARHGDILDAAIWLIARSGMDKFEMDLVAERADVAVGTLYRYFDNNEGLMRAIVERVADGHIEAMRAPSLLKALRGLVVALQAKPRLTAAMFEQPPYVALLAEAMGAHVQSRLVTTAILGAIRACVAWPAPKVDADALALLLLGLDSRAKVLVTV